MNTPVFDFIQDYLHSSPIRLHMPGHKGKGGLGCEARDITEVEGADVLYHEDGILKESQCNGASLFGTQRTLYSTEGSTLAIRAMLTLAVKFARSSGKEAVIVAGRNAHKAFLTSAALLDFNPIWLNGSDLLSCRVDPKKLEVFLDQCNPRPTALYLTSPDYLGNLADIETIARICHQRKMLLLVDNAHGAYLQFLPQSSHPMALGADLCCDSAHKTLPVLTGGAYLHIGRQAPSFLAEEAPNAMALFASTSPSYLILQSLDLCNRYLDSGFRESLSALCEGLHAFKKELKRMGFVLIGSEPTKITVLPKSYGYTGLELANILRHSGIEPEFADPDHTVLMFTQQSSPKDLEAVRSIFAKIPPRETILRFPPKIPREKAILSPRQALFAPSERISVNKAKGRILADPAVMCPPAIPIALCGEELGEDALAAFSYYGIETVTVVK